MPTSQILTSRIGFAGIAIPFWCPCKTPSTQTLSTQRWSPWAPTHHVIEHAPSRTARPDPFHQCLLSHPGLTRWFT
jgi:hypothetical protein